MDNEQYEGEIASYELLDLQLNDEEVARVVGNRVQQSEDFWNSKLDLKSVREENERYWMNNTINKSELYDFQIPYQDPKIFVAIESLIPMALSQPPQPIVVQADNTDASKELSSDLADVLLTKYEDLYIKTKLMMVARHLLIGYRIGVMKYGWDNTIGEMDKDGQTLGDITVETLRPHSVVISSGVKNHDKIPLIGEYMTDSLEDLGVKFPNKKDEILKEYGISAGVTPKMSKEVGYIQTHFSYYDKSKKHSEGIIYKLGRVVMGGTKTPLYNYNETSMDDKGEPMRTNFFAKPQKPYVFFNFLNLGKYIYDSTSLTEQAANMQDIVNKTGRQITENADSTNGGLVFNAQMINQESVAKLVGDPRERVMVNGPVNQAVARIPNTQLEEYVLMHRQDSRGIIDNVFSTHGAIRGEATKSNTLGQDVLSQRGDIARITTLSNALEDGMDRGYKWMVQLMKVFYTDPQTIKFTSEEGSTRFLNFWSQSIEDGVKIRVKTGSALPDDPTAKKQEALQLAPLLDPLALAEGLGVPKPKQWAKRNMLFKLAPDRYFEEFLDGDISGASGQQDPQATQDIQQISAGQPVDPPPEPTKEYLTTYQAFIESPQFKQLPPEIQQAHLEHIKAALAIAKGALKQPQQEPTAEQAPPEEAQPGMMSKLMGMFSGGAQSAPPPEMQ